MTQECFLVHFQCAVLCQLCRWEIKTLKNGFFFLLWIAGQYQLYLLGSCSQLCAVMELEGSQNHKRARVHRKLHSVSLFFNPLDGKTDLTPMKNG